MDSQPAAIRRASTGTETAERVADVLVEVGYADSTIGVSAIARNLRLSKAVVHRILQALASRGLVSSDPKTRTYRLGPTAVALGTRALQQLDLRSIAREHLIELRNDTQETVTLTILAVDKATYVDQCEGPQEIRITVELGVLYPLYARASSRAILAYLPASHVERMMQSTREPLESSIPDPDELDRTLTQIREQGYALSRKGAESGISSVAAPIFGGDGVVAGSISVCGPSGRFDPSAIQRYIPLVVRSAAKISDGLGWNERQLPAAASLIAR